HVLDAVDLLLERRRDRARDGLRRCARVDRRDLDGRRHDLRILRDRQDDERTEAHQGHENAQHGREDRPVDKEMRQAHSANSPRTRVQLLPSSGVALYLIVPSCGVTRPPGMARTIPSMITRSPGARPERMTRKPPRRSPVSTGLGTTVPSPATVMT